MADFAITNERVWPTKNDVGPTEGDGRRITEQILTTWAQSLQVSDFVISGISFNTSGGLSATMALGAAFIDGYYISLPANTTVTLTGSATNYIWLILNTDAGGLVDSAYFQVQTVYSVPTDPALLIATAVTGVGSVSEWSYNAARGTPSSAVAELVYSNI